MAQTFSVYLLWLSAIFDPIGALYGFRYIALITVFLVMASKTSSILKIQYTKTVHAKFMFLFFVFYPSYGLIMFLIRGEVRGQFIDTSYFASAVYFASTLLFFQRGDSKLAIRAFLFSTRVLSVVVIICSLFFIFSFSSDYIYYFVESGAAYFGDRVYGGVAFYYIYFVASPMLVFLMAHESWCALDRPSTKNIIRLFVAFIALFLSGTRFSMIVSLFTLPVIWLFRKRSLVNKFAMITVVLSAVAVAMSYYGDVIGNMFSFQEDSNKLKLSYLEGYYNIFSSPVNFIFGQGFNAHEWSYEFSRMLSGGASKTELTYFELIRVFGIFGASFFFFLIFYFFILQDRVLPEYRWVFPGLAIYLLMSSTNPYIFSSNGMLIIGLAAAIVSVPLHRVKSQIIPVKEKLS